MHVLSKDATASKDQSVRLDALEIRVAHQDRTIADLNDVIAAQWREIDALKAHVRRLREDYRTMNNQRDAPEPPPPHY